MKSNFNPNQDFVYNMRISVWLNTFNMILISEAISSE